MGSCRVYVDMDEMVKDMWLACEMNEALTSEYVRRERKKLRKKTECEFENLIKLQELRLCWLLWIYLMSLTFFFSNSQSPTLASSSNVNVHRRNQLDEHDGIIKRKRNFPLANGSVREEKNMGLRVSVNDLQHKNFWSNSVCWFFSSPLCARLFSPPWWSMCRRKIRRVDVTRFLWLERRFAFTLSLASLFDLKKI